MNILYTHIVFKSKSKNNGGSYRRLILGWVELFYTCDTNSRQSLTSRSPSTAARTRDQPPTHAGSHCSTMMSMSLPISSLDRNKTAAITRLCESPLLNMATSSSVCDCFPRNRLSDVVDPSPMIIASVVMWKEKSMKSNLHSLSQMFATLF